jgi:hypothetical protein
VSLTVPSSLGPADPVVESLDPEPVYLESVNVPEDPVVNPSVAKTGVSSAAGEVGKA